MMNGATRNLMSCICIMALAASGRSEQADSGGGGGEPYRDMNLQQLMDLDVTSVSKQAEPFWDAPAAIDVVTSDEIRRSGAWTLPGALSLADNLDVARKNTHDWAISARGFNTALSNKLLVLMDGRTLYTPLFSGVFWDVQDYLLEDIDRIEVVSGPGGTLWGANAVNGVINITSKSARDTQGLYLETGGGDRLNGFAGARYGGMIAPGVYFRIYGKYVDDRSGVTASGADAANGWHMGQGGFRIDATATPDDTVTLQGDLYGGLEGITTGGIARTGGGNVLGRWSHVFSGDADASLQVYYDRTHLSDPIPASAFAGAGILVDDLGTSDVDFQDRFRMGTRNRVVWGLGYRFTHDVVSNAPSLAFYPTTLDKSLASAFLQDEIRLSDSLFLTVGSKIEHNGYTGTEKEPSARIRWNIADGRMLWAAVSRAVRTPSRVDRDIYEPNPPPKVLVGEPTFTSETVVAYELGYRARIGRAASVSVSTFYNAYNDIRSLGYTPVTILPLFFQNNLEGNTHGGEVAADWQALPWWRLHAGYDLLSEHLRVKPGRIDLNNALNETADPRNQVSVRSSMDLGSDGEFDVGLRHVDMLRMNNGGKIALLPAYYEMDARLGWRFSRRFEVSLTGQNLLHARHVEYGLMLPTQEEIERSVYGKAVWRF